MSRRNLTVLALAAYIGTVLVANWLTTHYGLVPVGFGLAATAGTYAAGLALGLRDAVQNCIGKLGVQLAMLAAAGLSYLVASPAIATASAVAFLAGETVDFAVYTPLRRDRWPLAVAAAGLLGGVIDTYLFLSIAGFPIGLRNVAGQLVGKAWAIGVFIAVGVMARAVSRYRFHRADQVAHA